MANETPKKPIRRVTVPTVSKEKPAKIPVTKSEGKARQNTLLFFLFILVSGIIYLAIFQRPLLSKYILKTEENKPVLSTIDTIGIISTDSLSQDEVNTFIGQDKKEGGLVYPVGSKYYLVAGSFIFYPYAEKCRDRLKAEGYDSDIISTGEPRKFHRVYIQSSEDSTVVCAQRDKLRSSQNMDVWVYVE